MFRGRCSTSNGCLLLVELTASYAAAVKQQSVLLFYGCGVLQITSAGDRGVKKEELASNRTIRLLTPMNGISVLSEKFLVKNKKFFCKSLKNVFFLLGLFAAFCAASRKSTTPNPLLEKRRGLFRCFPARRLFETNKIGNYPVVGCVSRTMEPVSGYYDNGAWNAPYDSDAIKSADIK